MVSSCYCFCYCAGFNLTACRDYIGGHLSTFLYAMPLTKATRSHYMTSNCLRNSSSFASEEHYLTEYQLVTDTNMLAQLFGIRILQRGEPDEFSFLPSPIPLANYVYWQQPMKGRLKFGFLLPRKDFNRWFYALFFRLLLPMNTDIRMYHMIVLSPLNITILFRLMIHLQRIGYPSHWLAEVLSNILEDKVTSTCRPPRTTPLQIKDVLKDHPSKHLTTRPFAEELATFTAIFQPLLPLYISPTLLPQRESIHRYSFSLTRSMELRPQSQNMILVLFDDKIVPPEAMFNVRPLLDPSWGEIDSRFEDPRFQMGRKEGIFVWLTIERDFENHTVEAWMPDRFVDRLKALGWAVSLWRGDTYNSIWDGEKLDRVRDVATKGKPWVDTGVD